ncbi:MAG: 2-oxo acid dehydrogenase subunit E2 [Alphaproteobacteria bacterium]|nr:2-oxo acid dehydrogenase subunit E2 [Alphaproteobacteria bacterium]
MAELFEMPQASPTMETGTILAWRKEEGAELAPQDVIAEVETDKAAMEIEVFDPGFLLKILVPEGEEVPAGTPIAIIGKAADEDISALLAEAKATPAKPAAKQAAPEAVEEEAPAEAPAEPAAAEPAAPAVDGLPPATWHGKPLHEAIMEPVHVFGRAGGASSGPFGGRVRSSPAARKAARERGVDIDRVAGTGPRGRVTVSDVEGFTAAPAPTPDIARMRGDVEVRNSQMRRTIAKRLTQVWRDAPVFYLTARFDCDRLVVFREQLKDAGLKVSYNDIIIKAVARALVDVPEVNASWGEQAITRHRDVNIGMAVALEDGLITPVVFRADELGLAAIAEATRELATRARDRKLRDHEYTGSTFTVSNLGMMDIEHFTAIINPPEAGILAVGGLQQEPVVRDGQLVAAWQLRVTMTCDHRVIDGALGARFLQAVRRYVENPALLAA